MSDKMPETQREFIAQNPSQGLFKRVLCVCSGGILRSPTAAFVLSQPPYNFNTRSAGTKPYALIQVDSVLLAWADEVVCMEHHHEAAIQKIGIEGQIHYPKDSMPPIKVLQIPDIYNFREPALITRIQRSYDKETQNA